VMVTTPVVAGYELAVQLMGYGTVLDGHAGVKGGGSKPRIAHEVDLNNDIHYKPQCYQATHGSGMHVIALAHDLLASGKLPLLDRMTTPSERFPHTQLRKAIERTSVHRNRHPALPGGLATINPAERRGGQRTRYRDIRQQLPPREITRVCPLPNQPESLNRRERIDTDGGIRSLVSGQRPDVKS